jgi:phosphatidylserine decarboxylase
MKTLLFQESAILPTSIVVGACIINNATTWKIALLTILFLMYFYRTPEGPFNQSVNTDAIYSPCYGEVISIEKTESFIIIKVFLSIFDIHTQWYPVDGKILSAKHYSGEFHPAYLFKKTHRNEQTVTVIQRKNGEIITVRQVAGLVARRIVNNSVAGADVVQGTMMGMIKLSSQVVITFPATYTPAVVLGQKINPLTKLTV